MGYMAKSAIRMYCLIRVRVRQMNRYTEDDEENAQTPKQASREAISLFPISGGRVHGITIPYRLRCISAKRGLGSG